MVTADDIAYSIHRLLQPRLAELVAKVEKRFIYDARRAERIDKLGFKPDHRAQLFIRYFEIAMCERDAAVRADLLRDAGKELCNIGIPAPLVVRVAFEAQRWVRKSLMDMIQNYQRADTLLTVTEHRLQHALGLVIEGMLYRAADPATHPLPSDPPDEAHDSDTEQISEDTDFFKIIKRDGRESDGLQTAW